MKAQVFATLLSLVYAGSIVKWSYPKGSSGVGTDFPITSSSPQRTIWNNFYPSSPNGKDLFTFGYSLYFDLRWETVYIDYDPSNNPLRPSMDPDFDPL